MRTLQIHSHKKWKEGLALGSFSYLKIQSFKRNLSHYFLLIIIIYFFQLGELLTANLLYLGFALLSEGHTCSDEMSGFLAAEAEFFLNAVFAFFRGKLRDSDGVYDHGIRVMGLGG